MYKYNKTHKKDKSKTHNKTVRGGVRLRKRRYSKKRPPRPISPDRQKYIDEQYKKNEKKALLDNLLYSPNEYKNISYTGYRRNFPGTKLSEQNLLELKNIAKKELNNSYAKENVNNYERHHPEYNNFNNKSDIFNTKLFNTNIK